MLAKLFFLNIVQKLFAIHQKSRCTGRFWPTVWETLEQQSPNWRPLCVEKASPSQPGITGPQCCHTSSKLPCAQGSHVYCSASQNAVQQDVLADVTAQSVPVHRATWKKHSFCWNGNHCTHGGGFFQTPNLVWDLESHGLEPLPLFSASFKLQKQKRKVKWELACGKLGWSVGHPGWRSGVCWK